MDKKKSKTAPPPPPPPPTERGEEDEDPSDQGKTKQGRGEPPSAPHKKNDEIGSSPLHAPAEGQPLRASERRSPPSDQSGSSSHSPTRPLVQTTGSTNPAEQQQQQQSGPSSSSPPPPRQARERVESRGVPGPSRSVLDDDEAVVGGDDPGGVNSVEKDAAHFKMVATRFRALMERRERRLEEAMSDPNTRKDLETMFPSIQEGDYQTLLAGVRGMEEEDFQALLTAARKRRREEDPAGADDGREDRKLPKTGSSSPSMSSRPHHRPPLSPGKIERRPWDANSGGGGQQRAHSYYPHHPPHPNSYTEPHYYSRSDPRGGGRHGPHASGGSGGGPPPPPYPADDDRDDPGVFPHYSAPTNSVGRGGGDGGGGVDGRWRGGGDGGGAMAWSRHSEEKQWYYSPATVQGGEAVVRGSGSARNSNNNNNNNDNDNKSNNNGDGSNGSNGSKATPTAAAGVGDGTRSHPIGVGSGGGGDSFHHPSYYHQGEVLNPRGAGGPRGGRGGRGDAAVARGPMNRMNYDAPPTPPQPPAPMGQPSSSHHHHPYPGRDRASSRHEGEREGGGDDPPAPPPHGHAARKSSYVAVAGAGARDPESSSHNESLREAVENAARHQKEKRGGAGRGATAATAAGREETPVVGAERGGQSSRDEGALEREEARASPVDSKKVAMRLTALMESYDGRLEEVLADPRAKAELDTIYPGLEEREFRVMLRGYAERPQENPPPLYRKPPADRDYYDAGEHAYRREQDQQRMYDDPRERDYHLRENGRRHHHPPAHRHHPQYSDMDPPMYQRDPQQDRYPPMVRHGYAGGGPSSRAYRGDSRDYGYPLRPGGGAGDYQEHSSDARGGGGGGSGEDFLEPKRECPEDVAGRAYDVGPEGVYPDYPTMRRGDPRGEPPAVDVTAGTRGGAMRGSSGYPSQMRVGARLPPPPHATAAVPAEHPMYSKTGPRQGARPPSHSNGAHHMRGSHSPADGSSPLTQGRRASDVASSPSLRTASTAASPPVRDGGAPPPIRAGPNTHGGHSGTRRGSRSPSRSPEIVSGVIAERTGSGGGDVLEGGEEAPKPFNEVVRDASGVTRLFIPETPPIVPRRPPSKGNKRETLGDIAQRIPVSIMRPYFNYPLRTAAEAMNISVTTLKRLCRRHGVKRWPHRQISGINRAMAHLEFHQDQAGRRSDKGGTGRSNSQVSAQMQELLRRRKVMIEHAFESDDGGRPHWRNSFDSDDETQDADRFFSDNGPDQAVTRRHGAAPKEATTSGGPPVHAENSSHDYPQSNGGRPGPPATVTAAAVAPVDHHGNGNGSGFGHRAVAPPPYSPRRSSSPGQVSAPVSAGATGKKNRLPPSARDGGGGGGGGRVPISPESPSEMPPSSPPAKPYGNPAPQMRRRLLPASRSEMPQHQGRHHYPHHQWSSEHYHRHQQQQPRYQHNGWEPQQQHQRRVGSPEDEEDRRYSSRAPQRLPATASRSAQQQQQMTHRRHREGGREGEGDVLILDQEDEELERMSSSSRQQYEDTTMNRRASREHQERQQQQSSSKSRGGGSPSEVEPSLSPQQQQQQLRKRKQQDAPEEQPPAQRMAATAATPSSPSSPKQQQSNAPIKPGQKPPSPLMCGPRSSSSSGGTREGPGGGIIGGGTPPTSKASPALRPGMPGFSLNAAQEAWGAPTAPTASAS